MKKINQVLKYIYTQNIGKTGIDFLHPVIKYLADITGKDNILVSRISDNGENPGSSVVFLSGGRFLPEYIFNLKDTPCSNVATGNLCIFKKNVRTLFPDDKQLSRVKAESFIGAPLWSSDGKVLGLIAMMDRNPITDDEEEEIATLLQVISVRVAQSLEGEIMSSQKKFLEMKYKQLFDNARTAIFIMDPYIIYECNPYTLKMFECERDEIIGKMPKDFSPALQIDGISSDKRANEYIQSALEGEIRPFEWLHTTKNGREFYALVILSRIEVNSKYHLQAIVHDITSSKKSGLLLQQEKDFAEMLIDTLPGYFFMDDISDGMDNPIRIRTNKWMTEKLGYSNIDLTNTSQSDYFSPAELEKFNDTSALLELRRNNYCEIEAAIKHKDGFEIPYLWLLYTFKREDRTYLMGFGIDISEKKQAEWALQISEQKFRNIFNHISDGIIVMDMEHRILNVNFTVLNMFGYKIEDVVFDGIYKYIPVEYHAILDTRTVAMLKDGPMNPIEIEAQKSNGELITVEISSIIAKYGDSDAIITTVRDISERKSYEKKIFNSVIYAEEKEREHFARELHDGLGPILSTCKIYLHSLSERLDEDKDLLSISRRALVLLDDALGSIKEISNNLSPHILRNFGLVQAVLSFTNNLETVSGLNFRVNYNYDGRLDDVIEFALYRILTELINNTIKYSRASLVEIALELNDPELKITYSDNGIGFDLTEVKKLNKGHGLLNMESRVRKLNGKFEYITSPGNGCNVAIVLNSNYSVK
jgi:PAS domain S-box-containing protein